MGNNIRVSEPVNMNSKDAHLFEPHLRYTYSPLKIKKLKGPFVSNSGLVCNKKGLIKECYHHGMEGEFNKRLNEVSHYYHAAYDDPEKLIILDEDETYLLIHHTWHGNYYHWICETLLRLWMVKDEISKMILLLPSKVQMSAFAKDSLEPFIFKDVFYIPYGKSVLVRTLCMPQIKPVAASYNPLALRDLKNIYIDYTKNKGVKTNFGKRIYLSRNKSKRRKITNEDEVVSALHKYNFTIIYNEDYSFFEQIALYSNATCLISIHGAGLTNMLFMPTNSTVFELHKRQTNDSDRHSLVFWYMADALKHRYYHQICEPTDPEDDFFVANFRVDIEVFKRNLELMFSN